MMKPALKDAEGHEAVSMKAKEALVRKSAFLKPPANLAQPPILSCGTSHLKVTPEAVSQALMTQAAMNAPGPDKINFRILQIIWSWDWSRVTNMVYHALRLGYHPTEWKKARGILPQKGGKRDFDLVSSYRVISLLNCMGKVVEKFVAQELSEYCEENSKLHPGQIGGRKKKKAIDAVEHLYTMCKKGGRRKSWPPPFLWTLKGLLIMFQKSNC